MTLLLDEQEVTQLVSMDLALEAAEEALRGLGDGTASNQPRRRVRTPKGILHTMAGAVGAAGMLGAKCYTTFPGGARFVVLLFSGEDGRLLAIMEADRLGQMRTGAASGVATKYLARPDADSLALLGSGWQARAQLEAICAVRPIRDVRVYSPTAAHREAFAREMAPVVGRPIRPCATAEEAVRGAAIVTTITTAREPVLLGEWLEPGMHVNAAGSNWANRRELDVAAVQRADLIFADSVEDAQLESGDLVAAVEAGALDWARVGEIGEVIAGRRPGRADAGQITLFESQGLAVEDVALAARVYHLARARGLGREQPLADG